MFYQVFAPTMFF